jgi:hypothetical protein
VGLLDRTLGRRRLAGWTLGTGFSLCGRRHIVDFFLEAFQSLPNTFANLWEPAGAEDDQNDHHDDDQFPKAECAKHL